MSPGFAFSLTSLRRVPDDRGARHTALFHALDGQSDPTRRRDLAYSHIHQGWPEVLDPIWVSVEFVAASRFALVTLR